MKTTVTVEGLADLERALAELPKATGRAVLVRTLRKAAAPIRDAAQSKAPRDTGALIESIAVSTAKPKGHSAKKTAFASAMRAGKSRQEAGAAARAAKAGDDESFAEAFVGPRQQRTRQASIKTMVQEFGSVDQPGTPYMRPAWDANKTRALDIIKDELGGEIVKAARRLAKKAARGK